MSIPAIQSIQTNFQDNQNVCKAGESTSSLTKFMEMRRDVKKIELMIHFDADQNVVALGTNEYQSDKEKIINTILSKVIYANWDGRGTWSYYTSIYSTNYFHPNIKKEKVENFFNNATLLHKYFYFPEQIYKEIEEKYNKIKSQLKDRNIFSSVIKLIRYVRNENLDFHIILRSYDNGKNGKKISEEIERELPNEKFSFEIIKKTTERQERVYEKLKFSDYRHVYTLDSKFEGKTCPIDLTDEKTIVIYTEEFNNFELNEEGEGIMPVDAKTGSPILKKALKERKCKIEVDPYKAIVDEDYYINAIRKAFKEVGKSFGSIEQWETHDVYYV